MSSKITPKLKVFSANALIRSIESAAINEWTTGTVYTEGSLSYYGNNKYVAKNGGTSGITSPTHTGGTYSDGVVFWIWIGSFNISSDMFKNNLYLFTGHTTAWDDENTPDEVNVYEIDEQNILDNILAYKKVLSNNIKIGVKRYNWTTNTIYSSYDNTKNLLSNVIGERYETPNYVLTDDYHLYRCIDNNNGATSVTKPTGTSTSYTSTADGYVWKYLGSIDINSYNFLTADYIPINNITQNDGSPQWLVQSAAKKNSISNFNILEQTGTFGTPAISIVGTNTIPAEAFAVKNINNTLRQVVISNCGEGYTDPDNIIATVKTTGMSGSGATISGVTVVAGKITAITIDNAGTGYSQVDGAVIILVDSVNVPSLKAIITPTISGGGNITNYTITEDGDGYSASANVKGYIIPGAAGAVLKPIMAPKNGHGNNIVTDLCANSVIISVLLTETEDYFLYGQDNAYRTVGIISEILIKGSTNFCNANYYIGKEHPDYDIVSTLNKADKNSGVILYVNNIKPITRNSEQEENIKIVLTY